MLLKEQKAKFSFLASDEEDEEDRKEERLRGLRGDGRERRGGSGDGTGQQQVEEGDVGEKEQRRKGERDKDGHRGKNQGKGGEGRKSPSVLTATAASSSTFSTDVLLPEESESQAVLPGSVALKEDSPKASSVDTPSLAGAHTPPYNGKSQVIQFHLFA